MGSKFPALDLRIDLLQGRSVLAARRKIRVDLGVPGEIILSRATKAASFASSSGVRVFTASSISARLMKKLSAPQKFFSSVSSEPTPH